MEELALIAMSWRNMFSYPCYGGICFASHVMEEFVLLGMSWKNFFASYVMEEFVLLTIL